MEPAELGELKQLHRQSWAVAVLVRAWELLHHPAWCVSLPACPCCSAVLLLYVLGFCLSSAPWVCYILESGQVTAVLGVPYRFDGRDNSSCLWRAASCRLVSCLPKCLPKILGIIMELILNGGWLFFFSAGMIIKKKNSLSKAGNEIQRPGSSDCWVLVLQSELLSLAVPSLSLVCHYLNQGWVEIPPQLYTKSNSTWWE